jgi:ketosteroid isomerase-like protein
MSCKPAMRVTTKAAAAFLASGWSAAAWAQAGSEAERAIRDALSKWTADFNARNAAHICEPFSPELRYDYRGFPERDYQTLCALLKRSLGDGSRTFSYALDIKEIIVSGDLAVVRLVWTLTLTADNSAAPTVTREPGLDVFRKQPDGSWKIVRYLAYEEP